MTLQAGILNVAAFGGFPPFVWRQGRRLCGGDIRLLEEFADHHRLKLSVRFYRFEGLWELPGRDMADVAASGLSRLSERSGPRISWSQPYSEVRRTALIRAVDRARFQGPEDFRRIAVVPNSAADAHARKILPPDADIRPCASLKMAVNALVRGEVDAVGTGSVSARYLVTRHPGLSAIDLHTEQDASEHLAFAVRPNLHLVDAIDRFLGAGTPADSKRCFAHQPIPSSSQKTFDDSSGF